MRKKYPYHLNMGKKTRWFEFSGDKREPRKGEFYLSGAIPEVYDAPNDLSTVFHIMEEVTPPKPEIMVNGFKYRLSNFQ